MTFSFGWLLGMADFRLSGSYAGGRNLISTDSPGDISILDAKHTTLTLYTRVPETVLQGTLNTVYVPFRVIQYMSPAVILTAYSLGSDGTSYTV